MLHKEAEVGWYVVRVGLVFLVVCLAIVFPLGVSCEICFTGYAPDLWLCSLVFRYEKNSETKTISHIWAFVK